MEVRLRDLLLDIEDRIHQGTLGTLKVRSHLLMITEDQIQQVTSHSPVSLSLCVQVMDRQVWRSALEAGNYELLCSDGRENGGMNGRVEAMEVDSNHLRARDRYADSGRPGFSQSCLFHLVNSEEAEQLN